MSYAFPSKLFYKKGDRLSALFHSYLCGRNAAEWLIQMKTFCKLTAQSPAASYVPLPRFLLQDETLCDISNDAKVLYALLLDRASISRQNGYVEPDGTIRLYFTLEQAQTKLHRSRQSATRIFRELEYNGLIIRRKQGLGKPALITLNYPADAKLIVKEEVPDAQT